MFGSEVDLRAHVFALKKEFRRYSKSAPWKLLPPLFGTMRMMPPDALPYSAGYAAVSTCICDVESVSATPMLVPFPRLRTMGAPSKVMPFSRLLEPLMLIPLSRPKLKFEIDDPLRTPGSC